MKNIEKAQINGVDRLNADPNDEIDEIFDKKSSRCTNCRHCKCADKQKYNFKQSFAKNAEVQTQTGP